MKRGKLERPEVDAERTARSRLDATSKEEPLLPGRRHAPDVGAFTSASTILEVRDADETTNDESLSVELNVLDSCCVACGRTMSRENTIAFTGGSCGCEGRDVVNAVRSALERKYTDCAEEDVKRV